MSANRKLRFQRLPGGDGLAALMSLFEGKDLTFSYSSDGDLWPQLRNAFVQMAHGEKKMAVVVTSELRERLKRMLTDSEWGLSILCFDQIDRLPHLDRSIKEHHRQSFPDGSGSWQRLYNAWDLLEYHEATLKTKALGENDLEHLMAQLALSRVQQESDLLDLLVNPGDFDFNTQEYWSTRGRVHQAASLYRVAFETLTGLPLLHPIFGEMYASQEARVAIQETTSRLLQEVKRIHCDLSEWAHHVYSKMTVNEQRGCNSIRQGLLDLRQKIAENGNKKINTEGGWLASFPSVSSSSDSEDLVAAYRALRKQAQELGISNKEFFCEANNPTEVDAEVSRALRHMNAIKRIIKVYGDDMRQRLNRHTIKDEELLLEYDKINNEWSALLEEINGFQLLKEDRVDVSLDIPSQLKLIEVLAQDLTRILKEGACLEDFIEWMHFDQSLDQRSKKLITYLKRFSQDKWLDIFDTWYAKQYIFCQDLPTIDSQWFKTNWSTLLHHLTSREDDVAMEKMVERLDGKWRSFVRTHKAFAKWLNGGKTYDSLDEDLRLSARAFQVVAFTPEEIDEVELWDPDVILEIGHAHLPRRIGPTVRWIQSSDAVQNTFNFFPSLHNLLLHSDHSKRIEEIKVLADHLTAYFAPFEIWQNSHEAYLVFCSKEVKRVIWKGLEDNFQRIHINGPAGSTDLVETFINNRHRKFSGLFSAKAEADYSTNDLTILWDGLTKVGVENHYLCWTDLMQKSPILSRGRHQQHGNIQPPFKTHPVVKGH